ncbi:galectin-4-like isoform X2 [Erythrolamprus reginae]
MAVCVEGTVPKQARRFLVDFAWAQDYEADISLHFNPRFDEDVIVLHTYKGQEWENQEVHQMPLQKDENFKIVFVVNQAEYQIMINGNFFCTYKHRLPPQMVQVIRISGDLDLHFLNVTGEAIMEKRTLPYYHPVPGGLHPGMSVYVQGIAPKQPKRFRVDFAWARESEADISLHFNPRFDGDVIVLHTYKGQEWENQEVYEMPLQKGKKFKIVFMVNQAEYQIMINGNFFCTYKHRLPPQMVQVIRISGDLDLHFLNVTGEAIMEKRD